MLALAVMSNFVIEFACLRSVIERDELVNW